MILRCGKKIYELRPETLEKRVKNQKNLQMFRKRPNVFNGFRMRPNASQWVRTDPNGSEPVRKPRKTREKFEKPRENFEKLPKKRRLSEVRLSDLTFASLIWQSWMAKTLPCKRFKTT